MSNEKSKQTAVQTTGHAWDGDLQEFNNPLPRWWLWGFYATVVFAVVYWFLYPSWPVGDHYTKGLSTVSYVGPDGKEVTTHWNTRALLAHEMQEAQKQQQKYVDQLKNASFQQIASDPAESGFAYSRAKVLFADNCAACHQQGGGGVVGMYPNLADDSWLWGGDYQDIKQTITHGRRGFMPSFRETFNDEQLDEVASYVLSLSGHQVDPKAAAKGREIFNGQTGGCYYCHTHKGTGLKSQGSANLTDSIWTIAKVPSANTLEAKKAAVEQVIRNGVTRVMPTWEGRLSDTEIKILAFYVHQLGGGS